jgi:hypothetical protein
MWGYKYMDYNANTIVKAKNGYLNIRYNELLN